MLSFLIPSSPRPKSPPGRKQEETCGTPLQAAPEACLAAQQMPHHLPSQKRCCESACLGSVPAATKTCVFWTRGKCKAPCLQESSQAFTPPPFPSQCQRTPERGAKRTSPPGGCISYCRFLPLRGLILMKWSAKRVT